MKKSFLTTVISMLSISIFAHPGHTHSEMSNGTLLGHLLWIIIPAAVLIIAFFAVKKRKSVKH